MNVKSFYYDWCIRVVPETVDLIEHYLDLKNEPHAPVHNFIQRAIEENKDCYFTSDHNYAYLNKGTELPNYRRLTGIEFSYYILEPLKNYTMEYPGMRIGNLESDSGKWFRVKDKPEYRNAYYSVVKHKFDYDEEKEVKYEFEGGSPIYTLLKDLHVLNTWCEELPKQKELHFGNRTVILELNTRRIYTSNGRGEEYTASFDEVLNLYEYLRSMPKIGGHKLQFDQDTNINFGCVAGKFSEFIEIVHYIREKEK